MIYEEWKEENLDWLPNKFLEKKIDEFEEFCEEEYANWKIKD
jgi:hypothetical protein